MNFKLAYNLILCNILGIICVHYNQLIDIIWYLIGLKLGKYYFIKTYCKQSFCLD